MYSVSHLFFCSPDEKFRRIETSEEPFMATINYGKTDVDGLKVFYRRAGGVDAPKLLLLHGFPSAGHMFRNLIPQLMERFHIIAPDLPGFGQSDMPSRDKFHYTFDNIAHVIHRFTEVVGFNRFAIYVFDYGAPTGFALETHCDEIAAVIRDFLARCSKNSLAFSVAPATEK
jgi:pimeloyl-ACP methyl ester carboxylesterase